MHSKIIKTLLAVVVFGGAILTSVQVDQAFQKEVAPELRIEAAPEDFILEYTTTSVNQTVILPFGGATNVMVDWNDGTAPVARTFGGEFSKTYPIIGTYQIKITGTITNYGFGTTQYFTQRSSNGLLRSVIQWGTTGVVSLQGAFMGADNLTFVPDHLPSTVTDLSYLFHQKSSWTNPLNNISSWNTINVTNMSQMFNSAGITTTDITGWNTSNVIGMAGMFSSARFFNQAIGSWDVSKVVNFNSMFERAFAFNSDIGAWNTSSATTMAGMFYFALVFNQNISSWDVSNVTDMRLMFEYAEKFNQPLNNWDVGKVTNFQTFLKHASAFNQPLDQWNVGSATNMSQMFESTQAFNQELNSWDVSKVTNFAAMFRSARLFNKPLDQWDTSSATTLFGIFESAREFNQNINSWDVSNVTQFSSAFNGALVFNQPLDTWDVSKGVSFNSMFRNSVFNQDISSWNVSSGTSFASMFEGNTVYNKPLNTWNMSAATSIAGMFSGARAFNQPLDNWNVANVVDMNSLFSGAWAFNQDITMWNTSKLTQMYRTFFDTRAFNQNISTWDVSKVTNFVQTFYGAQVFNQPIGSWNTGSATNMGEMFSNNPIFDQYIGEWDVSKVSQFYNMFNGSIFNQDISGWDTSSATTMANMFSNNQFFNQPIGGWNTSKVTNMNSMFQTSKFNQPIGDWDTGNVTSFFRMFYANTEFNQPIGDWNLAKATQIAEMFSGASKFNQDLAWQAPVLTSIYGAFQNASAFNGDVSTWNVSAVTNFYEVFSGASAFNQPLNTWNVSNSTNFQRMFRFATAFNQPLDTWNTSKVVNMERMFENNAAFSQDLSTWDFSKVVTLEAFMSGSVNLNPLHYDAILQRLTDQTVTLIAGSQRQISFGQSKYSKVANALKDGLISSRNWSISDGGQLNLIIKVDDQDKYFGEEDPDYTITYTGLAVGVGEETLTNAFVFNRTPGETVGEYTVTVTGGDERYYYVTYQSGILTIGKPEIDLSTVTWNYEDAFVYTGTAHTVELLNVPALITVSYTGNTATNAGTYTASVDISYDSTNYELSGDIAPLTWVIDKAIYDITEVDWDYSNVFTYDGTEQTVLLVGLPTGVTVLNYTENRATYAGTYTASATLSYDTDNYSLLGSVDSLTWIIEKATYDMSEAAWDYDDAFDYDMTEKTVLVIGLPDGVTVDSYIGNQETEPGFYTASVVFAYDTTNYEAPTLEDLDWEIFAETFTITFDSKGGSAINSISGIFGSSITMPANPTRSGYTFNGWSSPIPSTMPNQNLTITASWAAITTNNHTNTDLVDVIDLTPYEGDDVSISLILDLLLSEDLTEDELALVEAFISENIGSNVEQLYYSIRLLVETTNGQFDIQETENGGFILSIVLPEDVNAETFYVIQAIDGVVVNVAHTYDAGTRTVSFNVSKLGLYAIAYEVNTFNLVTALSIGAGVTALLGFLWFILFGRRRKEKEVVVVAEAEEESMEDKVFFKKDVKLTTDFYATLTTDEKAEFDQYFINDTPTHFAKDLHYVKNGDNQSFFKDVFRYIYRYRRVISYTLLVKLIDYVSSLAVGQPTTQSLIYEAATKTAYARRQDNAFLDLAIELSRKDIALQRDKLNPRGIFVYSFYRLSIILEKQKNYPEALVLVNEALARKLKDDTKGGYLGRKTRLIAKK